MISKAERRFREEDEKDPISIGEIEQIRSDFLKVCVRKQAANAVNAKSGKKMRALRKFRF